MSDKNGAVPKRKSRLDVVPPLDMQVNTEAFVDNLVKAETASQDVTSLAKSFGFVAGVEPETPVVVNWPLEPIQATEPPHKATKKIAIVGKAPSTIPLAPYGDPEWEIWGLSDLMLHEKCTRWTRWFELHDPEGWHPDDKCPRRQKWHPKYWEHLTKQHEPPHVVYVAHPHPDMPHAVQFPHQRLIDKYSIKDEHGRLKPYFTNTVSWLIAFAIDEGATHISVYGVDMAQQEKGVKSEYAYQRPSCEYFIGWAAGHGCEVVIPEHSDLMKAHRLYGVDALSPVMRSLHNKRKKDLTNLRQDVEQKLAQKREEVRQLELRQHVILGAQDDNDQWWGQQVL